MITKGAVSIPAVWNPDQEGTVAKKLANSCEITALKLTGNAGAAYISLYDGVEAGDAKPTNLKWAMDSSQQTPDTDIFSSPLVFKRGVYAVLEQGAGSGSVLCLAATRGVHTESAPSNTQTI